jgi:hypothetical protein
MPKEPITRYNVDSLIQARKVAMNAKLNTLYSSDPNLHEKCLKVDIRRVDSTAIDLSLEFYPRIKLKSLPGVTSPQRPSASLMWRAKRVRGLDYALRKDVLKNGIIEGSIRGWHEHYWTDEDEDQSVRTPNPSLKNFDMQSVIAWCCKSWNIEGIDLQAGLYL